MGETGMPKAVSVQVLRPYVVEVAFSDGTRREIDLETELWGPVFAPLRDPALFARATLDPLFGSVFWPTGADLAPEFLYYGDAGPPPAFYRPDGAEDQAADAEPALTDRR